MTSLFPPLSPEVQRSLDQLPSLINKTFPLPGRFRAALPKDVAELSRLLTSDRKERDASYLGRPAQLSAYMRYFLPWNIFRLCRLLPNIPLHLKPEDAVIDLGSGPLTLVISLWISRPELRNIPLEFRCIDKTPSILDAGKKLFAALTAKLSDDERAVSKSPWIIKSIRGEVKRSGALSVEVRGKAAAFTAAINLYNELYWDFSPVDTEALDRFSERQAHLLSHLTDLSGSILVLEPGIPRSGEFISLLRSKLIDEKRLPLAPCTHSLDCPLPARNAGSARKEKWCHFAFDTEDAPVALHKLSFAAGIPKERAVLSFVYAGSADTHRGDETKTRLRIISDAFPLQNAYGRYACSERGLVLVTGNRRTIEEASSGSLVDVVISGTARDEKSGALIAALH